VFNFFFFFFFFFLLFRNIRFFLSLISVSRLRLLSHVASLSLNFSISLSSRLCLDLSVFWIKDFLDSVFCGFLVFVHHLSSIENGRRERERERGERREGKNRRRVGKLKMRECSLFKEYNNSLDSCNLLKGFLVKMNLDPLHLV